MTRLEQQHAPFVWNITRAAHADSPMVSMQSCLTDFASPDHIAVGIMAGDGTLEAFARASDIAGTWHIIDVGVVPELQRTGRGRRVVDMLLEEVRQQGDQGGVTLEVHAANVPARAVYERAGFSEHGRRSGYYPDGGDAIIMWRPPAHVMAAGTAADWEPVL